MPFIRLNFDLVQILRKALSLILEVACSRHNTILATKWENSLRLKWNPDQWKILIKCKLFYWRCKACIIRCSSSSRWSLAFLNLQTFNDDLGTVVKFNMRKTHLNLNFHYYVAFGRFNFNPRHAEGDRMMFVCVCASNGFVLRFVVKRHNLRFVHLCGNLVTRVMKRQTPGSAYASRFILLIIVAF